MLPRWSRFVFRHRVLFRHLLLFVGVLTYLMDREDVVWRFINHSANARLLEHLCFGIAAVAIGVGTWLRTSTAGAGSASSFRFRSLSHGREVGEILYAIGLGSLLPWPGCLLFVGGEIVLAMIEGAHLRDAQQEGAAIEKDHSGRRQVAGWCAFVSMLVFTITLSDRLAEVLFSITATVSVVGSLFPAVEIVT